MSRVPWFMPAILLALTIGILHASPVEEDAEPGILDHVVVIGASASAGYGTGREIGEHAEDVPFSELLRAMIKSKKARITDVSDSLFFIAPESTGVQLAGKAKANQPTCVIAIDYLFWFAYGQLKSLELRRKRLATGLKLLEELDCTLLISELPDMRRATAGGKLSVKQVPDKAMLEALNRQIVEWAKPRKNVLIVPLKRELADLYGGKAIHVARASWKPPRALAEILQGDKLHPTIMGLGMMAALSLETLIEKKRVSGSELALDPRAATKQVIEARKKANG